MNQYHVDLLWGLCICNCETSNFAKVRCQLWCSVCSDWCLVAMWTWECVRGWCRARCRGVTSRPRVLVTASSPGSGEHSLTTQAREERQLAVCLLERIFKDGTIFSQDEDSLWHVMFRFPIQNLSRPINIHLSRNHGVVPHYVTHDVTQPLSRCRPLWRDVTPMVEDQSGATTSSFTSPPPPLTTLIVCNVLCR